MRAVHYVQLSFFILIISCQNVLAQGSDYEMHLERIDGALSLMDYDKALNELRIVSASSDSARAEIFLRFAQAYYYSGNNRMQLVYARKAFSKNKDESLHDLYAGEFYLAQREWKAAASSFRRYAMKSKVHDRTRYLLACTHAGLAQQALDDLSHWQDSTSFVYTQLYALVSKYDSAMIKADHIISRAQSYGYPFIEAYALQWKSLACLELGRFAESERANLNAIDINQTLRNNKALALNYNQRGYWCYRNNRYSEAEEAAKKSVDYAKKSGDLAMLIRALNISAIVAEELGNHSDVLTLRKVIAQHARELNDPNLKALAYNNLGYLYYLNGITKGDSALMFLKEAHEIYKNLNAPNGQWFTSMNLVMLLKVQGKLADAQMYTRAMMESAEKTNNPHAIIEAIFHRAELNAMLGDSVSAAHDFSRGKITTDQQENRDKYVFDCYYAPYLWQLGHQQEAVSLLQEASTYLSKSEKVYQMAARVSLAYMYSEMNQWADAERELAHVDSLSKQVMSFATIKNAQGVSAIILVHKGEIKDGLALINQAIVSASDANYWNTVLSLRRIQYSLLLGLGKRKQAESVRRKAFELATSLNTPLFINFFRV
jgi:tetratricopeptide (TPR) repeat protein